MRLTLKSLLLMLPLIFPSWVQAKLSLPEHKLTPGAINRKVHQNNIGNTICVHGWTRTVRPSDHYTNRLKKRQIVEYRYTDMNPRHYEEDHLIPLDLGGSPTSARNLWPEPHLNRDQWGSRSKDRLEVKLLHLVCKRRLELDVARKMIAANWIRAFKMFVGPRPDYHIRHKREDR